MQDKPQMKDNVVQLNRSQRRAIDQKTKNKLNPHDYKKRPGETDEQLDQRFINDMSDDDLKGMFIIQTKNWDDIRVQLNMMAIEMNKRGLNIAGKPAKAPPKAGENKDGK